MLLHGGPRRVLFEETVNVVVAKTFVDMEARTSREQCAFVRQSRSIGAMPLSRRTQFRIMSWPLWSAISEIPLHGEFVDEISHKLDAATYQGAFV